MPKVLTGTKIANLPAGTALLGTERIPMVQAGGTDYTTPQALDAYIGPIRKAAVAAQALSAADTYLTDSRLVLPQARMQAGVVMRGRIVLTKTAAGVASPVFSIRAGTAGSTADTAMLTYTGVAQTAVVDTGYLEFQCTFRVVGASAVLASWLRFDHDLASTGFATATRGFQGQAVSSTFNSAASNMGIGVSINPGASAAWTMQQSYVELVNLAN